MSKTESVKPAKYKKHQSEINMVISDAAAKVSPRETAEVLLRNAAQTSEVLRRSAADVLRRNAAEAAIELCGNINEVVAEAAEVVRLHKAVM